MVLGWGRPGLPRWAWGQGSLWDPSTQGKPTSFHTPSNLISFQFTFWNIFNPFRWALASLFSEICTSKHPGLTKMFPEHLWTKCQSCARLWEGHRTLPLRRLHLMLGSLNRVSRQLLQRTEEGTQVRGDHRGDEGQIGCCGIESGLVGWSGCSHMEEGCSRCRRSRAKARRLGKCCSGPGSYVCQGSCTGLLRDRASGAGQRPAGNGPTRALCGASLSHWSFWAPTRQSPATSPPVRNSISPWNSDLNGTDPQRCWEKLLSSAFLAAQEEDGRGPGTHPLCLSSGLPPPTLLCSHHFQVCTLKSQFKCHPARCLLRISRWKALLLLWNLGALSELSPASHTPHVICL